MAEENRRRRGRAMGKVEDEIMEWRRGTEELGENLKKRRLLTMIKFGNCTGLCHLFTTTTSEDRRKPLFFIFLRVFVP
jgi:hypothetical protein